MKKSTLLKIVNFFVMLLFIVQAGTGILHSGLPDQIFSIHGYTGYAFAVFIVLHLILNWAWIRSNFLKNKKAVSPATN
jgi:heme A synthase